MMGQERSKAFKYEIKSAALAVSSGAFNDGLMFANSAMILADNAIEMDVIAELADHAVQYLQIQHDPVARDRFTCSLYEFVLGDSLYSPKSTSASVIYQDSSFQQSMSLHAPSGSLYLSPTTETHHNGITSVHSKKDKHLSKRQESLLFTESFLHGNLVSDEVTSKSFVNLKQRAEGMKRQMLFGQPAMTDQEQQKLLAAKTELMRSNTLLTLPNRTETLRRAMSARSATSEQHDSTTVSDGLLNCCTIM
ncbi:hypothetical protein EON65_02615 [archaeon]|nr:MAG: hypothetical protein EON65_02615 [archaeon]